MRSGSSSRRSRGAREQEPAPAGQPPRPVPPAPVERALHGDRPRAQRDDRGLADDGEGLVGAAGGAAGVGVGSVVVGVVVVGGRRSGRTPPLEEKWQYSAATTLSEQVYRFMVTPQAEESTVRPLK